jgi:glycosyltransferase involved in cell wall biosynthesis
MLPPDHVKLTIVIPACNEEKRIGRMLDAYLPFFADRYGAEIELVVVINGTTDGTEGIVRGYAARFPSLRAIVEPARIGKGGALMKGFRAARGDLVGFADADGSTPPDAFQDLVARMADADAIIASRWCRGAHVSPQQPLRRRVASRAFNLLTRVLFGLRLTDTQCGAKVVRGAALRDVLPHLGTTQWAFDVDLLFQLRRAGYAIREIPTVWRDVEGSGIRVVRNSMEMSVALVRLRLFYSPFRFLVRAYERTIGRVFGYPGA